MRTESTAAIHASVCDCLGGYVMMMLKRKTLQQLHINIYTCVCWGTHPPLPAKLIESNSKITVKAKRRFLYILVVSPSCRIFRALSLFVINHHKIKEIQKRATNLWHRVVSTSYVIMVPHISLLATVARAWHSKFTNTQIAEDLLRLQFSPISSSA